MHQLKNVDQHGTAELHVVWYMYLL